ncbi:CHD3-type chromatin-remodeling factor [Aureococcus anophagefferens]|nr:CHD3-type chromatin-remodeling factor [Aureococcus anophagefferens]
MSDANNAPSPPASVASTLPGPLSPAGVAAEVDAAFASDAELRLLVRQRRVTFKAVRARVAARLGVDEALLKEKALKAALRDAATEALEHDDECFHCGQAALADMTLLNCDLCTRSYHFACADLAEEPTGVFACPACAPEGLCHVTGEAPAPHRSTRSRPRASGPLAGARRRGEALERRRPVPASSVKWAGLDYDDCTWEREADVAAAAPEAVAAFDGLRAGLDTAAVAAFRRGALPGAREALEAQPPWLSGGDLHGYQLEGVNWLRSTFAARRNVILADEMGLGKTIQAAGLLAAVAVERPAAAFAPALVVAPLSTLANWRRELGTWCPWLSVVVLAGAAAAREELKAREGLGGGPRFHVLVTSYEHCSTERAALRRQPWSSLIVDEGHRLKGGAAGRLFQELAQLDAEHRVLLTGTPFQNNLDELHHLLDFLDPAMLAATVAAVTHKRADVLRAALPGKRELVVRVELSAPQKALYRAVLTKNYDALAAEDRGRGGGAPPNLQNVVIQLRKVCDHCELMYDHFPDVCDGLAARADPALPPRLGALLAGGGKLALLDAMLVKLKARGHRVLVFSQMTKMLDVLGEYCALRSFAYERLDGDTAARDRARRIDRFNAAAADRAFLFLLSTLAASA